MSGSRPKFYVDWADQRYPEIKVWEAGCGESPATLTEAKQEIIKRFEDDIAHGRLQIEAARAVRIAHFRK